MTGIALGSLEHVYRPAAYTSRDICHWCSLGPEYHQNVPRYAQPRSIPTPPRTCPTECCFLEPCDAPCHEVHWLVPLDHSPDSCPRLT